MLASLTGCGSTYMGRATTGAGLGSVAGAFGAVAVNGNPIAGALIGAGVGGIIGVLTERGDDPQFY